MKFGIVGTNFVSDFFMDGAKQESRCEVVAVSSLTLDLAKEFGEKHKIEYCFKSYQDMYEANVIEAVYIAVPNALHKEVACYFLERKIPVFLEKPMASNYDEVVSIMNLAKENNVYIQEGLIPLYNPNFIKLKESIKAIGRIHQVVFNFSKYSSRYDAYLRNENPTTFQAKLSNGAIMDLGVYIMADCVGLFGKPNKVLSACSLLDTKADISGSSILIYDDFIATLMYSKASDTTNSCEINGEDGSIFINTPSMMRDFTIINRKTSEKEVVNVGEKDMFYYEIKTMIDCVEQGVIENTLCSHETSLAIHSVLTECREQAGVVFPQDKK
ncbi:Gfo/Idh/MocA family protein [Tannockella kyphosi]|uniref:Gfo/Idh/MocA family protein n=1 Tax=Tannockella kyphosi TaxID=2899121 RepID=UPI0020110BD2|nr:Gfo/Idh/MocA family oxidoreductase [Tannockella kyphosi]